MEVLLLEWCADLGREALKEDVHKRNIYGDDIGLHLLCKGMRGTGGGTFVLVSACGEVGDIRHHWGEGHKGCRVGLFSQEGVDILGGSTEQ